MMKFLYFLVFLPSVLTQCPVYAVSGYGGDTRCYVFKEIAVDYFKATELCNKISGNLLSIPSVAVNTWIQSQTSSRFAGLGFNAFWIGADVLSGTWAWQDGSVFAYQLWQTGQPLTSSTTHNCGAAYATDGTWFSSVCNAERPSVCIVPPEPTQAPHEDPKPALERVKRAVPTVPFNFFDEK